MIDVRIVRLPPAWRQKHLGVAEQRVLELAAEGLFTKEIAVRLGKSPLTARNQLIRGMKKLGVKNRYELMAKLRPIAVPPKSEPDAEWFAWAI